ncbi:MAG: hypothetical protein ABSG55_08010 [Dehalococcoidia bacterium]
METTFSTVTGSGDTSVDLGNSGPAVPAGYQVVGIDGQPVYFDINTTATFSGLVTVCISYDPTQVVGPESDLKLMHYVDGAFVDITVSVDTVNNVICGQTTSLSPFVIVEPVTPAPTATATATSVPPTATSVPPTATSVPATATSLPATATSLPATATSLPATATSVPATATGKPTATATRKPTATSTPKPRVTPYDTLIDRLEQLIDRYCDDSHSRRSFECREWNSLLNLLERLRDNWLSHSHPGWGWFD